MGRWYYRRVEGIHTRFADKDADVVQWSPPVENGYASGIRMSTLWRFQSGGRRGEKATEK